MARTARTTKMEKETMFSSDLREIWHKRVSMAILSVDPT
jgi:hypothetical protein